MKYLFSHLRFQYCFKYFGPNSVISLIFKLARGQQQVIRDGKKGKNLAPEQQQNIFEEKKKKKESMQSWQLEFPVN